MIVVLEPLVDNLFQTGTDRRTLIAKPAMMRYNVGGSLALSIQMRELYLLRFQAHYGRLQLKTSARFTHSTLFLSRIGTDAKRIWIEQRVVADVSWCGQVHFWQTTPTFPIQAP